MNLSLRGLHVAQSKGKNAYYEDFATFNENVLQNCKVNTVLIINAFCIKKKLSLYIFKVNLKV